MEPEISVHRVFIRKCVQRRVSLTKRSFRYNFSMSALGHKRTSTVASVMSAFGVKADKLFAPRVALIFIAKKQLRRQRRPVPDGCSML